MGTPQSIAARLAEAQADLAAVLGAEQRALELAGNYRAMAAEQDTLAAERIYLQAEVQQRCMAAGYAKHADWLNASIKSAQAQLQLLADAEVTA